MRELLRTNDLVHLSWVRAVLAAEGIETLLLDQHVSGVEGSIGAIPRRLMVADRDAVRAETILAHASGSLGRA